MKHLRMEQLPKSIIIVGGGVIGIEWASMLADFGVEVTVLEYADRIIPTEDQEISKEMQRIIKKKGIKIITGAKVLPETLKREKELPFLQKLKVKSRISCRKTSCVRWKTSKYRRNWSRKYGNTIKKVSFVTMNIIKRKNLIFMQSAM